MHSAQAADIDTIRINVLLFSVLRERVGLSSLEMQLTSGSRPRELLDELSVRFPAIATYREVVRIAVNQTYVDEDAELNHGDEVALITPVSGG